MGYTRNIFGYKRVGMRLNTVRMGCNGKDVVQEGRMYNNWIWLCGYIFCFMGIGVRGCWVGVTNYFDYCYGDQKKQMQHGLLVLFLTIQLHREWNPLSYTSI